MPRAPRATTETRRFTPRDRAAWTAWLEKHHATEPAVALVFYRKSAGVPTISYAEAVEEALCFGWIDGIKHRLDDERYTYRFTPRRPGSAWSAINRQRLAALDAAGKLRPAGRAAIDAARASGAWDLPARANRPDEMPAELTAALRKTPKARATFDQLPPSHQRAWRGWVDQAKRAETRERRAAMAAAQLAAGKGDPRKL
jgi:uncharacterized protein YdeI (YjbR/CyaY-like superfamily)